MASQVDANLHNQEKLQEILVRAGLPSLLRVFISEKIDADILEVMPDDELKRLGITTIGDRVRIRESAKQQKISNSETGPSHSFPGFRNFCTQNFRSRSNTKKNKEVCWTAIFFCLSSVEQQRTPNCLEREILHCTGLGLKKIKIPKNGTEEEVIKILESDGAFPKLRGVGGFEFLRTVQNGRDLQQIPPPWASQDLRLKVGPQARIYIRPIQHSIPTEPGPAKKISTFKVACEKCFIEFPVQDLREHVKDCQKQPLDFEELPELPEPSSFLSTNDAGHTNTEQVYNYHYLEVTYDADTSYIAEDVPLAVNEVDMSALCDSNPTGLQNQQEEPDARHLQVYSGDSHKKDKDLNSIINTCIIFCKSNDISNPVEILRKLQKEIITGRPLEVEDPDSSIEGETNFITVDRENILETSFEEIMGIPTDDLRQTLEVQFYNEQACDYGGPRKEFFRLVMIAMKEKYFDKGWRDLIADDYRTVGIIIALSILQNGSLPTFLTSEMVETVFDKDQTSSAVIKFREGLNALGMFDLFVSLPELKFLFQSAPKPLTVKKFVTLMKPKFSDEGSNSYQFEKEVYALFIKYLREVAAGRRGNITLASILRFTTSTDDEPVLGFLIQPSIIFSEVIEGFLPTASTCINSLTLPRPSQENKLPQCKDLFNLYDYAFCNSYYGLQ